MNTGKRGERLAAWYLFFHGYRILERNYRYGRYEIDIVARDRYMIEQDALYPQYGFARNKGYGTAEHIAALKQYGPCPIHRRSFIGHFVP